MLFYRSTRGAANLSVPMIRALTATCLSAYPVGALVLALAPKSLATSMAGYALILLALLSYAPLIGSSIQRIVGEQVKLLDEFELRLRGRALSLAYAMFTGLMLLAILYAALASDNGAWVPSSYGAFNGLFWGVFLYAAVLPTAILSWLVEPSFNHE